MSLRAKLDMHTSECNESVFPSRREWQNTVAWWVGGLERAWSKLYSSDRFTQDKNFSSAKKHLAKCCLPFQVACLPPFFFPLRKDML